MTMYENINIPVMF